MSGQPVNMDDVALTVNDLQRQLAEAHSRLNIQQNELAAAAQKVGSLEQELVTARNQRGAASEGRNAPKKNKPSSFNGKGSVSSWCVQMDNYLGDHNDADSMNIALSYLTGNAHEWWIVFSKTGHGSVVNSWHGLKEALFHRFETLNKEKIARDKLARWKQVKDVPTFNEDFNKILLDIPDIGMKDQIDRYSRGLKPYIWKALCTKEYNTLSDLMRDAERIEAAYRGQPGTGSMRLSGNKTGNGSGNKRNGGPVPMEIGNVEIKPANQNANTELKKLDKEERERCMREGLCLRCRQKGHMARNCPKGRRN